MINFFTRRVFFYLFQYPRILKYKLLSTCKNTSGSPAKFQPVLMNGIGKIDFDNDVHFGVEKSPFFYNGYIYIDARRKQSNIIFRKGVRVNNNCFFIAEGEGIEIGPNTLIGANCEIIDSDFHDLNPKTRKGGPVKTAKVIIKENVFISSNVKILKGVTIGKNSVIANGSVVTKSIPEGVLAGGIPAKVIKSL
jgi:acetyltransferase-like isoleucine patch superfamily enzyme